MSIDRGIGGITTGIGIEKVVETEEERVLEATHPVVAEELGRGHRRPTPSVKLRDYVTYNASARPDKQNTIAGLQSQPPSTVPGKTKCLYPITDYIIDENFSEHHKAFSSSCECWSNPEKLQRGLCR